MPCPEMQRPASVVPPGDCPSFTVVQRCTDMNDALAKHRQCSPEERPLGAVRTASGREEAAEVKEAGA